MAGGGAVRGQAQGADQSPAPREEGLHPSAGAALSSPLLGLTELGELGAAVVLQGPLLCEPRMPVPSDGGHTALVLWGQLPTCTSCVPSLAHNHPKHFW